MMNSETSRLNFARAGVRYPFFGLLLSPMIAAALCFSSVSAIVNALRLRRANV